MTIADDDELKRKLKLVLSQVTPQNMYPSSNLSQKIITDGVEGKFFPFVPPKPGAAPLVNEQLPLLRLLYAETAPRLKSRFVPLLLSEINTMNVLVVTHAVLEIGALADVTRFLSDLKGSYQLRYSIWVALLDKLVMEPNQFTEAELDALHGAVTKEVTAIRAFTQARMAERLERHRAKR